MLRKPTAIGLAIVAVLASIALVAVLEWRGQQPVTIEETEDVASQGDLNMLDMQQTLTDQINSLPRSAAQERMESETGMALSRLCIQWTELTENHPTDESLENRDEACREYRDYVENGTLPNEDASAEETAR